MIVALYARVSTTRQADMNLSIPDQLQQMRDWCGDNGHSVAMEYVEPGASATDDKRPVFLQMMEEAKFQEVKAKLIESSLLIWAKGFCPSIAEDSL